MSDDDKFNLDRLIKMMGQTTNDNDHLALVAIRTANRLLKSAGADWDTILRGKVKIIADPFASIPTNGYQSSGVKARPTTPYKQPTPQPYQQPQPRPAPTPPPSKPRMAKKPSVPNRYAGTCTKCKQRVDVNQGLAVHDPVADVWRTEHHPGQCPPPSQRRTRRPSTTDDLMS